MHLRRKRKGHVDGNDTHTNVQLLNTNCPSRLNISKAEPEHGAIESREANHFCLPLYFNVGRRSLLNGAGRQLL